MEWCFQCGLTSRPSKAVGVDEDGEPACSGHQVKEIGAGLNAATASRTAVSAPIGFGKAFEAAQIKPAAPSPVQIKQEKVMDEKFCIVEGCGKKLRSDNNSGYCKPHRNETKKLSAVRKSSKRVYDKALDDLTDAIVGGAKQGRGTQSIERVITLQLGESKVQELLDLLLQ